jgi:uncharacterized protein (TIGR00369 family)
MPDGAPAIALPFISREPARGAQWDSAALQMSGLEIMRAQLERRLPEPPITVLTGLRVTDVSLGKTTFAMPASPWWQTGAGVFLAGTLAFVADAPLGCAIFTGAPAGVGLATSELSVSFLRPGTIRSQMLIGRGSIIHATRSLGLSEAYVEDGRGRLLAHATSRCVMAPIPPIVADRPARDRASIPAAVEPAPYLAPAEGEVEGQDFWDSTPGIEVMRRYVSGTFVPPVFRFFGLRGVALSDGEMTIAMPASPWLSTALGVIYGGALALLADAAITTATATTLPPATAFSPLDLKVNYLRPVVPYPGDLVARARVVHRGRTIAVVTCEIINAEAKTVAMATASVLILPGRPWDRPVYVEDELTSTLGEPGRSST